MKRSKDRWKKREAFAALLEKGEYQGFITTEYIITVFPDVYDSEVKTERLQNFFRSTGIEVYEDLAQVPAHLLQAVSLEEREHFDLSSISSDDTVGLYLKEMARVPLLSLEEEVDLATRIERSKDAEAANGNLNGRKNAAKRAELKELRIDAVAKSTSSFVGNDFTLAFPHPRSNKSIRSL